MASERLGREELLARLAEIDDSPEGLQEFNRLIFGSELHEGQLRFESNAKAQVNLLSPGNSWGKTEWIGRSAARRCIQKDGVTADSAEDWLNHDYRGLVCSYHYGQAGEVFQRLERLYNQKGNFHKLVNSIIRSEPQRIVFYNGATLDFGSLKEDGRLIDAPRRHFVFVDEVGQIPNYESVHNGVVYPRTLGVGGVIFLVGTPKPYTDPFVYHIYELGKDDAEGMYYSQEGTIWENSFWPESERVRIRRNTKYFRPDGSLTKVGRQVVEGKFELTGGLFFNRLRVARMFSGRYDLPVAPEDGRYYLGAWDIGGSQAKSDRTVGFVFDISDVPWRLVRYTTFEGSEATWDEKFDAMEKDYRDYHLPFLHVDVTGSTQDSIAEQLENRGITVERVHFGGAGVGGKKYNMLRSLQSVMEMQLPNRTGEVQKVIMLFPDPDHVADMAPVKKEFDFYILEDKKLKQDHVMTAAMVAHAALLEQVPDSMTGEIY